MCGIAGAVGIEGAANAVSLMLRALQHRGQQAAGVTARDATGAIRMHKGFGLVDEVFGHVDVSAMLPGNVAFGHVRYPTTGDPLNPENNQPLTSTSRWGEFAVGHNGNLSNGARLRKRLERRGATFRSTSDTEIFPVLYAGRRERELSSRLKGLLGEVEGAYSLLGLASNAFFAVRDPYGFRPLMMARHKGGWLFASESRAFDIFDDVTELQEVPPGHFLIIEDGELHRSRFADVKIRRFCSFEKIYFSMPDSVVGGETISQRRERLGVLLAQYVREAGIEVDVVCPVPDSSTVAAIAVAEALGLPFRFGVVRNKYMGRTFISPNPDARKRGVRMKLNADVSIVAGKRVLLVDDSIVRGTTLQKIVQLLLKAGALEVHIAVSSPPVMHPCFWGIDTPERKDLIAAQHAIEELPAILGAQSVTYLPVEDLREALDDTSGQRMCVSCFTGCRPVRGHTLDNGGYD